jgi:hypothetical protein
MIETVPSDKSNRFELIAIFIIATAAFIYFTGGAILNPTNVKWLYWGDPATSYLGWQFFRDTALFQFPLGATPNYGVGFATSIMYTDSLPIIAIPLKFVSPLLPDQFQYFGAWIYASFFLQGYFAWKLLKQSIEAPMVRVVASTLFLIAPIFLYRLVHEGSGHVGLFGQFLVLWAVYLHFAQDAKKMSWIVLIAVSIFTCVALFPIVFFIFFLSQAFKFFWKASDARLAILLHFFLAVAVSLLFLWVSGGFAVSDTRSGGLGVYRSSLTSLIDSAPFGDFQWSGVLPNISDFAGSQEGFAFLGLAGLLLLPFAFIMFIRRNSFDKHRSVLVISLILAVMALSNKVSIANHELFSYPIPPVLSPVFDSLRASGRFTWPLVYVLLLEGLRGLYTTLQSRISKNGLTAVFAALLLLQLIDMRSASSEIRERFTESGFTASLTDPKWNELAKQYDHIVAVPPLNNDPGWFELALLANTWNMTSNAAYYGRVDEKRLINESARLQRDVDDQRFYSNTLYVITNYPPNPASPKLIDQFSGAAADTPGIHVYELDGFVVVAP